MGFWSGFLPLSAARANLRRLVSIRVIALTGQIAGVAYAYWYLQVDLRYGVLVAILAFISLLALATLVRLKLALPVTDTEYFLQLLLDVLGLSLLLYFAGGSTNPFISYYLVLLTITAATLPWAYSWIMTAVMVSVYSWLMFFYHPLQSVPPDQAHAGHELVVGSLFNLHILGMWLTFIVSALLITLFVVKMAQALRRHDEDLAAQREDALHAEQMLAVATLAAGAAHELGTPLSTLALLIDELSAQDCDGLWREDLQLMQAQVMQCKDSLRNLRDKSQLQPLKQELIAADTYVHRVLDNFCLMRPEISVERKIPAAGAPAIWVDEALAQALANLLNNAADASLAEAATSIEVLLRWERQNLVLEIHDYGSGMAVELADQIGKPFVSTKHKGLGLGLFLSNATLRRFTGSVRLFPHPQGGTLTEVRLPCADIAGLGGSFDG